MDILRLLPADEYNAAVNANAPTALNPFATIADLAGLGGGFEYIKTNAGGDTNAAIRRNINFVDSLTVSPSATDNPGTNSVDVSFSVVLGWDDVLLNDPNSGATDPILSTSAGVQRELKSAGAAGENAGLRFYDKADATGNVIDAFELYTGNVSSKAQGSVQLYGDDSGLYINYRVNDGQFYFDSTGVTLGANVGEVTLFSGVQDRFRFQDSNSNIHNLSFAGTTAPRTYTYQDSSGTLAFLTDIPAGAGDNIYNTDGTLTASRTVTINALALTLDGTGGNLIYNGGTGNLLISNGSVTALRYLASTGSSNGYQFSGFTDHKLFMTAAGNMFMQVDGNNLVRLQNAGGFRGVSINTGGAVPTATLDVQGVDDLGTSQIFNVRNLSGGEIIRTFADGEILIGQGGTSLGSVGIRTNPNVGELATLKVNQSGLSSARTAITAISNTGATAIRAIAANGPAMYLRKTGTADFDSTLIVNRITGTSTTRQGSIELRSNTPADNTQDRQMAEIAWRGTAGDTSGNENGLLLLKHAVAGTMTTGVSLSGSSLKANNGYDFETIDSTKGVVFLDRTNGNRYRIYTDGGVVNTELVP